MVSPGPRAMTLAAAAGLEVESGEVSGMNGPFYDETCLDAMRSACGLAALSLPPPQGMCFVWRGVDEASCAACFLCPLRFFLSFPRKISGIIMRR